MFLITGCGRSGTKYMAKVLRAAGLDVGHERPGEDGTVSAVWVIEEGPWPRWHSQDRPEKFDLILHQVREPLATIGSLTTITESGWDFVCQHTPIERDAPLLRRAAEHWYYWNVLCENAAWWTYQVEEVQAYWSIFIDLLGIPDPYLKGFPTEISRRTNTRSHPKPTWAQVRAATKVPVYDLARRYGYA